MTISNAQTGMYCLIIGIVLVLFGLYVWKQKKPDLIPGYRKKPGENTALYCEMVGKATILFGIGLIILSIPLPLESPSKTLAVSCLICCLVFIGLGISLFYKAQKR
jgi:uncharacterized membrane protein YfcA